MRLRLLFTFWLVSIAFSVAKGDAFTPPNLRVLFEANTIVRVDASDLIFDSLDGKEVTPTTKYLHLKSPRALRGSSVPATIDLAGQAARTPKNARYYLVFLNNEGGEFKLQNKGGSIIAIGSSAEFDSEDFKDEKSFTAALGKAFAQETDPTNAAIMSFVLASGREEYVRDTWADINNLKPADTRLKFAHANVGLRAVGIEALSNIKPEEATKYYKAFDAWSYEHEVQQGILTWTDSAADLQNADRLFNFALACGEAATADMIVSLAPYLEEKHLPELTRLIAIPSEGNHLAYACFKGIMHVANEGKGIITIEEFDRNPAKFISIAVQKASAVLRERKVITQDGIRPTANDKWERRDMLWRI